jgi:hypothetical protein
VVSEEKIFGNPPIRNKNGLLPYMISTKFQFIWESGFRGEDFLVITQSEKRMACDGHVCLLMDWN